MQNENRYTAHSVSDTQQGSHMTGGDRTELLEALFEKAESYIQTQISLFKLKTINKFAVVTASWLAQLVMIGIFFFFLTLLSIGVSIWIGNRMGEMQYGFLLVAGVYLLLFVFVWIFGKGMMKKFIEKRILPDLIK